MKLRRKKKSKDLPNKVFVYWDGDLGEEYLIAEESFNELGNGKVLGVYTLDEVKTLRVTEELV